MRELRIILATLSIVAAVAGARADDALAAARVWVGDDGTRVVNSEVPLLVGPVWNRPNRSKDDTPPASVRAALVGVARARALLSDQLGLPAPSVQVALEHGGGSIVRSGDGVTIVLDAELHPIALRRQAIEQYARVAAAELPAAWADALADWTVLRLASLEASAIRERDSSRLGALNDGNPLWFEFLREAYGITAVRVAVEELVVGGSPAAAFDRALARVTGESLAAAFREFHLWATLVGSRADTHHFAFAARLGDATFASGSEGLPALNVLADPPQPSWGATQVRLDPLGARGGMRVLFEGEPESSWDVDLLLVDDGGTRQRVAIELGSDGRGSVTVPSDALQEALLLIRNVGGDGAPARYSYAASHERGWPFELVGLNAAAVAGGVDVSWETSTERDLFGFNVLRSRTEDGVEVAVNQVWVPALGTDSDATAYHFFDATAQSGVAYRYRIEGISSRGLTRRTDAVVLGETGSRESPVRR